MIKFNPFKAGSIVLACLIYIFEWDKIVASGKSPEEKQKLFDGDGLKFVPDLSADAKPVEYFQKHRKNANEDGQHYPANSLFRGVKNSRVLWASQSIGEAKDWEKQLSMDVSNGIVEKYCQLHKPGVADKLIADFVEGLRILTMTQK